MTDDIREQLTILSVRMERLSIDVDKLLKVITDGNGHSLASRIAIQHSKMEDVEERLKVMDEHRMQLKLATAAGVTALFTSVATFLLEFFLKAHGG